MSTTTTSVSSPISDGQWQITRMRCKRTTQASAATCLAGQTPKWQTPSDKCQTARLGPCFFPAPSPTGEPNLHAWGKWRHPGRAAVVFTNLSQIAGVSSSSSVLPALVAEHLFGDAVRTLIEIGAVESADFLRDNILPLAHCCPHNIAQSSHQKRMGPNDTAWNWVLLSRKPRWSSMWHFALCQGFFFCCPF